MKTLNNILHNSLDNTVTTLAICWKLTLETGISICLTNHGDDILFENQIYMAQGGFNLKNFNDYNTTKNSSLEIHTFLQHNSITEEEVISGKYDHALIEVFHIDYTNINAGKIPIINGKLGKIIIEDGRFIGTIYGYKYLLNSTITDLYSPTCRAEFCDNKCQLNINNFITPGTVESIIDNWNFIGNDNRLQSDKYNFGLIRFTSGKNRDLTFNIRNCDNEGYISLLLPTPYHVEIGDSYDIIEGCDKHFETCTQRFNNSTNFRGEPYIANIENLYNTNVTT